MKLHPDEDLSVTSTLRAWSQKYGFIPYSRWHDTCTLGRKEVELVSWPWWDDRRGMVVVNVREPDKDWTMYEVELPMLHLARIA